MEGKTDGYFDELLAKISQAVQDANVVEDLSKEFGSLKGDQERASFLLKSNLVSENMMLPTISSHKDPAKSIIYRNEGNEKFKKKLYKEALFLYNKSVLFAPCIHEGGDVESTKEGPLAYANRSAALFHIKEWELCNEDIERAFVLKYPLELDYKLYERQGSCYLQMEQFQKASRCFEAALKSLDTASLENKRKMEWIKKLTKNIQTCEGQPEKSPTDPVPDRSKHEKEKPSFSDGENKCFQSLSKKCGVQSTPGQGRYIVAEENINPGDVILIEKPFASVVLFESSASHCYHCFSKTMAPMPCEMCTIAVFCSDVCKSRADAYHCFECPFLEVLSKSGVGKFGYLALRTITAMGLKTIVHFKETINDKEACNKQMERLNKDGKYLWDDYSAIYHLVSHSQDRKVHDLFKRGIMAVFLVKFLAKGGFFKECDTETGKDEQTSLVKFVCGLILTHLQSFPCNAHEISELELKLDDVANSYPGEIGAGIYSTLSLFNHSCDPTVNRNFYGNTCVVRAIRTIRKGEEVTDNYGAVFAVQTKHERQLKLTPQYFFECACDACVNDWPQYFDINNKTPNLICDVCFQTLKVNSEMQCLKCQSAQNVVGKIKAVKEIDKNYVEAIESLTKGETETAMKQCIDCLRILDMHALRPWRSINNCQEALKQCYSILGNCYAV